MNRAQSKNALVTGASMGIGKGIALALAENGYNLAISHLNEPEEAHKVAALIGEQYGRRCVVFQGNLEEEHAPGILAQDAIESLEEIHLLVNNAGITIVSPIVEMSLDKINKLYNLNFRAPILLMQAVGRHMIERNIRGSIINIASTRGERAYPVDAVYGGLKAALIRATQSIALELSAHKIRVNTIAPGAIKVRDAYSPFYEQLGNKIPLGRTGTPEDIGKTAVWLASDDASYITGTTIRVDGGLILPGMPEQVNVDPNNGWGRINK